MANEQNLVSLATRPQRERQEIARKGQKAATEAKRKKKNARELAQLMMNCQLQGKTKTAVSKQFGEVDENDLTVLSAMIAGQIQSAMGGNTKAFALLVDLMGIANDSNTQEHNSIMDAIRASAEAEVASQATESVGDANANK